MKKLLICSLIFVVAACGKYTTPKKVERKIVKGTWNIFEFVDNEKSLLNKYAHITMTFGDSTIATTSPSAVSGTWSVGTDRNPALLYMTFPDAIDSMHVFSDDWVVYKITKSECILKRNMGNSYDYGNSMDGLTLRKSTNE